MRIVKKPVFPEWAKILYRGIRAAIAAGIAQIVLIPDWQAQPERTLGLAFVVGFLPAFGMWARTLLDEKFGYDEKSLIARVMPL